MANAPQRAPIARSKTVIRTPPGILGYSSTITPDVFGDNEPQFKARIHWNEDQKAAFEKQVQKVMDDLTPELTKMLAAQDKKPAKVKTAGSWLEDTLKDPEERDRIQLPSYQVKRAAEFVDRKTGEKKPLTVKFYDKDGNLLDGAKLRTGMGSIVQLVLTPALWTSALSKGYALPSFRLEGIVVLKNEPWGSGGQAANAGDYDEAELNALLGEDIELDDDLTAFAQSAKREEDPKRAEEPRATAAEDWDVNDDIPF